MKLFVIAGLAVLSSFASAQTCKMELYGPRNDFITSVRTSRDASCEKAFQACKNWRAWYLAPSNSRCYRVQDDGYAVIDYVRFPDYDNYYGYPGSPYYRTPRVPQTQPTTTEVTTTTICDLDRYGREVGCRTLPPTTSTRPGTSRPGTTTETCDYYDDGTRRCNTTHTPVETRPQPRPETRPETRPTPNPTPTNPTPVPMPRPRPETNPTPTPRPNPTPVPTPNTNPVPVPVPTTAPGTDTVRAIEAGETVIFNGALHMVVSVENTNFYNLKPVNGRSRDIVNEVARQYVAVTRGCHVGFCANDSVIVTSTASYAAVAGIEYDGQLVTKTVDGSNTMTFDVNASTLAWTKGCTPEGNGKVCVGNIVLKGRGLYYTVRGIQLDGNAVIENNDGPKKLTINVNPSSLLIVNQQ